MSEQKNFMPGEGSRHEFGKGFVRRVADSGAKLFTSKSLETDTAYKAVDFVETYTGRAFYPLAPKAADISIIDIAHHLSNQCRYSGATKWMYSTAQHCCLLAHYVEVVMKGSPLDCLQILMHDGAEAYLVDVPRPVKQHMPEFRVWDRNIQMCIRSWLGLDGIAIPKWQDDLDSRIIVDERAQVMSPDSVNDWQHDLEPLGVIVRPWTPVMAEQQFLMRYAQCMHQVTGKHQYLRSGWGIPMDAGYKPQDFRTAGSDVAQHGDQDARIITDLMEVDIRGGVGRVAVRSPDGMMVRDTEAGRFPMPAWKWVRGDFSLVTPDADKYQLYPQHRAQT